MKDISDLRRLIQPSSLKQVKIGLLVLSAGSAYGTYAFGAPWPMVAFMGVFWLLPLFGMEAAMRPIRAAVEAYEGNHSVGTNVKWIEYSDSDSNSYGAEFDLGPHGKWQLQLHGAQSPYDRKKKDLPAVVTVWLHPESKEPCLIKSEKGYFHARKIERRLQ